MMGRRSVHQGLRDLAPAQSCLPLSPGLCCPSLTSLSPAATGPLGLPHLAWAWVQLWGVGASGPVVHTPWYQGGGVKATPFLPQAASLQLLGVFAHPDPGTEHVPE